MYTIQTVARAAAPAVCARRTFTSSTPRSLARMQIIGRLADTPESTPTSTGRDVVRYAVAVNSGPRDENGNRQTSWYRIASFVEGPQREALLNLPKGSLLHVEADARMDTYQAADGSNQSRLNLVQRTFETLIKPRQDQDKSAAEEPSSGLGAS